MCENKKLRVSGRIFIMEHFIIGGNSIDIRLKHHEFTALISHMIPAIRIKKCSYALGPQECTVYYKSIQVGNPNLACDKLICDCIAFYHIFIFIYSIHFLLLIFYILW